MGIEKLFYYFNTGLRENMLYSIILTLKRNIAISIFAGMDGCNAMNGGLDMGLPYKLQSPFFPQKRKILHHD